MAPNPDRDIEPFVMPRDLKKVATNDLRTIAYQLEARLEDLVETFRKDESVAVAGAKNVAGKAQIRKDTDWMLDYAFRRVFEDNIKDLRAELKSRIELYGGTEGLWMPIPEKGLVDEGFILTVGDNLSALARQIPDY